MTTTTYYNLNIVEGTDIVNPLIVDNPNYEKIDEVMHDNAVSGVTLATEIANATVHAITRENSECSVIRFIATSEWKAGDTVTVDGVPVTALLPSGETLPDGAYVINANVLCILTGTNLTVYAERKKTDNAVDIAYNDTNVAEAITTLNSNLTDMILPTKYAPIVLHSDATYNSNSFEIILPKNGWVLGTNHVDLSNAGDNTISYNGSISIFTEYTTAPQQTVIRREISTILCKRGKTIKFVGNMPQYCYLVLYPIEE